MFKKLFRFPLDVVQNSVFPTPTQILAKIYRAWLKECAFHKIRLILTKNSEFLYCEFIFYIHIFNAVLSFSPSSFSFCIIAAKLIRNCEADNMYLANRFIIYS